MFKIGDQVICDKNAMCDIPHWYSDKVMTISNIKGHIVYFYDYPWVENGIHKDYIKKVTREMKLKRVLCIK